RSGRLDLLGADRGSRLPVRDRRRWPRRGFTGCRSPRGQLGPGVGGAGGAVRPVSGVAPRLAVGAAGPAADLVGAGRAGAGLAAGGADCAGLVAAGRRSAHRRAVVPGLGDTAALGVEGPLDDAEAAVLAARGWSTGAWLAVRVGPVEPAAGRPRPAGL